MHPHLRINYKSNSDAVYVKSINLSWGPCSEMESRSWPTNLDLGQIYFKSISIREFVEQEELRPGN